MYMYMYMYLLDVAKQQSCMSVTYFDPYPVSSSFDSTTVHMYG